jgi:hypothetical protein
MESIIKTVREEEYPRRKRNAWMPFWILPSALLWCTGVLKSSGWMASPWFLFEAIKAAVLLALAATCAYLLWRNWDTPVQDMPVAVWRLSWALSLCVLLSLCVDLIIR